MYTLRCEGGQSFSFILYYYKQKSFLLQRGCFLFISFAHTTHVHFSFHAYHVCGTAWDIVYSQKRFSISLRININIECGCVCFDTERRNRTHLHSRGIHTSSGIDTGWKWNKIRIGRVVAIVPVPIRVHVVRARVVVAAEKIAFDFYLGIDSILPINFICTFFHSFSLPTSINFISTYISNVTSTSARESEMENGNGERETTFVWRIYAMY